MGRTRGRPPRRSPTSEAPTPMEREQTSIGSAPSPLGVHPSTLSAWAQRQGGGGADLRVRSSGRSSEDARPAGQRPTLDRPSAPRSIHVTFRGPRTNSVPPYDVLKGHSSIAQGSCAALPWVSRHPSRLSPVRAGFKRADGMRCGLNANVVVVCTNRSTRLIPAIRTEANRVGVQADSAIPHTRVAAARRTLGYRRVPLQGTALADVGARVVMRFSWDGCRGGFPPTWLGCPLVRVTFGHGATERTQRSTPPRRWFRAPAAV